MQYSEGSSKTKSGFGFLNEMKGDERDDELERKRGEGRKRKREFVVGEAQKKGMYGVPGWEWREREGRAEDRWAKEVIKLEKDKKGNVEKVRVMESIPLPTDFVLGKDGRMAGEWN